MIKCYDIENDNIVVDDKHNAEMISAYLNNFLVDHKKSLSDFNRICFEVVKRVLWRYAHYGFYKENQPK